MRLISGIRRGLELKVPPLVVLAISAGAIVAASRWLPAANFAFAGCRSIAVLLGLLGLLIALAGVARFRREKTTVNPLAPGKATSIVKDGIYSRTRHPMYLGMALCLLGLATWSVSVAGYGLVLAYCAYITIFQIQPEERALGAVFGEEYAAYLRDVRRWI